MGTVPKRYLDRVKLWKEEPWTFWGDVAGESFTADQMAVLRALQKSDRVVVPSAHAEGKTFLAARYAVHFLQFHRPARVVTTAPSWSQVEDVLWSEIRVAQHRCRIELDGTIPPRACEWRIAPDHFMIGLSPDKPQRMIGHHAPNQLIIIDEAAGVDAKIWEGVRRIASGGRVKVLAIGNPEAAAGSEEPFPSAASDDNKLWTTVYIDGYNHPNIVEGPDANGNYPIPGAITREWVEEAKQEWGEESPMFQALVRGRFPEEGDDVLISLAWVRDAINMEAPKSDLRRVMSIDVARSDDGDETVFTALEGRTQTALEAFRETDPDTMIERAENFFFARGWQKGEALIVVDDVGAGWAITKGLQKRGHRVLAFNGGEKPHDDGLFRNRREESWWWVAQALRSGKIKLLEDKKQKAQLCSVKKRPRYNGTFEIERKEDMRKRGVSSPDRADALVMAWYGRCLGVRLESGSSDRRQSTALLNRARNSAGGSRHRSGFLS